VIGYGTVVGLGRAAAAAAVAVDADADADADERIEQSVNEQLGDRQRSTARG
jgi:hypothetical protein